MKHLISAFALSAVCATGAQAVTLPELVGKYSFRYLESDPELPAELKAQRIEVDLTVKTDGKIDLIHRAVGGRMNGSTNCKGRLDLADLAKFPNQVVANVDCGNDRKFDLIIQMGGVDYRQDRFVAPVHSTAAGVGGPYLMEIQRKK